MGGTSTAAQLPADGGASSSRNKLVLAGYLACLLAGGVLGCLFGTVLENLLRHALPLPYANLQLHHVIFAIAFLAANVIFESESTAPLLLSGSNVVFGFLLARTASRIFFSSKLNEEWFLLSFLLFHLFEFYFVATFHAPDLRFGSFVLDPVPYHLYFFVFLSAGLEFAARTAIFAPPSTSSSWSSWTQLAGFFLTFGGLSFRVVALWTAGGSFTHVVQTEKRPAHRLVRTGAYGLCRHPGYVGWLCWSVGTQLLLGNGVNLVLFSGIGYAFLYQRIRVEEHFLVGFFGTDYLEYAKKVPAGVPFASQIERYERYHGAGAASPAEGRAERTMNKAD
eukprot:g7354.t1